MADSLVLVYIVTCNSVKRGIIMASPVSIRVQNHRNHLRSAGFRPVQIWVRDTRSEEFQHECNRQMLIVSASDEKDSELREFMGAALNDSSEWQ